MDTSATVTGRVAQSSGEDNKKIDWRKIFNNWKKKRIFKKI
jgi:hypothetical protein